MSIVNVPGHCLASQAAYSLADSAFRVTVAPMDKYGIVTLQTPHLSVSWSTEQWAVVIPALVAQLPAEQQLQVLAAINGVGVAE